jgi:hypothetical protein
MTTNLRHFNLIAAFAVALLGAASASAQDRMESRDAEPVATTSRLHNLVLYADARLAFYGSESSGTGCREREEHDSDANESSAREPAT